MKARGESGFSLIELLVATGLLLVVSSIVTNALMQMTHAQKTIWNRTEMHSGVRGATELLQQEVGQAGRVTLPGTGIVTITAGGFNDIPASPGACVTKIVTLSSAAGMWGDANLGIALAFLDGDNAETVRATAINAGANQMTGCFWKNHANTTPVRALGGFVNGVVPPDMANGSTATVLKMFGDINGDGNLVYVEYTCNTVARNVYRKVVPWNGAKTAVTNSDILLSNVIANPGGTPCFTYQTAQNTINAVLYTFVMDVAVTLTVETEQIDSLTRQKQTETKALLNVSPRNIFDAWSFAALGFTERVQFLPPVVTANLLP